MIKAWPALASATYIGCAWLLLDGCGQFDDHGLFAPPPEPTADASSSGTGSSGTGGGSSASTTTGTTTTTTTTTSDTTGAASTSGATGGSGGAAGGETGGAAGTGVGGGAGGFRDGGGAGAGGRDGGGGGSIGDGAAGTQGGGGASSGAGGGAGSSGDAGWPKICAELHTTAKSAHESAQACTQAGSFTECRLVQDECGCGVGVRGAATQATQRYLMAVQSLKDNGCFDACPDGGCPPYSGVTCTPGTQSRLQCIAY